MRKSLFVAALLMVGCTQIMPSNASLPSPLPSAAQPAVNGKGDTTFATRAAAALRLKVRDLEPEDAAAVLTGKTVQLADRLGVATCRSAEGKLPLYLCHLGPQPDQPVAQALLWQDLGWQVQLYPQADRRTADERRRTLIVMECQVGCRSQFTTGRQVPGTTSPELVAVVNLSLDATRHAEEAHLLRLVEGGWRVVWVPDATDWGYGHANVTLPARGTGQFTVRSSSWGRKDSFTGYIQEPPDGIHRTFVERWIRSGDSFIRRDMKEEPGPYGTLLRLIHYASTSATEKVGQLIGPPVPPDKVVALLAQKPKRQGWSIERQGETGFVLRPPGKQGLVRVQFRQVDGEWLLGEIRRE